MIKRRLARAVAGGGVASFLGIGAGAFLGPRSFYDQVATFPPYNLHFIHDIGAFQIGLGVALVLGLLGWTGLATALGGAAAGAVVHAVSHVIDRDLGGKATDPVLFVVLALVLAAAAWSARPSEGLR